MSSSRIILIATYSLVAICAVIQITASNLLATDGVDLAQTQTAITQVKKENIIISEKIYTASSLNEIASKAATLGFVPDNTAIFLSSPLPVAMNP